MLAETEFDEAIAAEETRLAELDRLTDAARTRLMELHTARDAETERATDAGATWSPERKVALFASLFRGREDVFPRRWEKPGKGRSGWAPRCSNEWVPGVCAKPRVRCGECSHQAFVARPDLTRAQDHGSSEVRMIGSYGGTGDRQILDRWQQRNGESGAGRA